MPRLIPERPDFASDRGAEKVVWEALRDQLPNEAVLIHGLRIIDRGDDREGDLVVLWPHQGVAVIEVKGGHITPQSDGTFIQRNNKGHEKSVDPIEQSRIAKYSLRDWLVREAGALTYYTMTNMAAFPYATINTNWHSTRATRAQVIDRLNLADAASCIKRALDDEIGRAHV